MKPTPITIDEIHHDLAGCLARARSGEKFIVTDLPSGNQEVKAAHVQYGRSDRTAWMSETGLESDVLLSESDCQRIIDLQA
jgi:hypothetical protein